MVLRFRVVELENVVKITRPTLWICTPEVIMQLSKLSLEGPFRRAIMVDAASSAMNMIIDHDFQVLSWDSAITTSTEKDNQFTEPSFNIEMDLVAIPFSSGTTGMPKGVMITHKNFTTAIFSCL